jgi:uncharacterized protein YndB with AHSA1/START domain
MRGRSALATMAKDPREVLSTRVFAAPREVLFKAFSDPTQLAQWWGPGGFTTTIHEFDLRPGGKWRLTLHGPNGADYRNEKSFIEVVQPERIVFDHLDPVHGFRMTMLHEEQNGKTRLTWRMRFVLPEEGAKLHDVIAEANEQNFDRLEAHLARPER